MCVRTAIDLDVFPLVFRKGEVTASEMAQTLGIEEEFMSEYNPKSPYYS